MDSVRLRVTFRNEQSLPEGVVIVGEIGMTGAAQRRKARRPNVRLRQARLSLPSPSGSGRPMSQKELAEAITAHVFRTTARVVPLDRHYVSRVERGVRRYPVADYRAAFRAVLGASSDAELGFIRPPRESRKRIGRLAAGMGAEPTILRSPEDGVTQLVVTPGLAVVIASSDRPRLLTLAPLERGRM
jgi:hypothetical protein